MTSPNPLPNPLGSLGKRLAQAGTVRWPLRPPRHMPGGLPTPFGEAARVSRQNVSVGLPVHWRKYVEEAAPRPARNSLANVAEGFTQAGRVQPPAQAPWGPMGPQLAQAGDLSPIAPQRPPNRLIPPGFTQPVQSPRLVPTLSDLTPGWREWGELQSINRLLESRDEPNVPASRRVERDEIERIRKQVESTLRDDAWTPDERRLVVDTYRHFAARLVNGDTEARDINNWSIWSEYRRLLAQEKAAQMDGRAMAEYGQGGFFDTYQGALTGDDSDYFGPGFIVAEDENGYAYITDLDDLVTSITGSARNDPVAAASLMTRLAGWQAYGAGSEKFVANRIQFDAQGRPVKGNWAKDDQDALRQFLTDVALMQASGDRRPWTQILEENAEQSAEIAASPGYGALGTGGGGGGGGGGGTGGVSFTPPDLLKQMINGVARARLGQVLSDNDVAAFVADFHRKEAEYVHARLAGLDATQVDPESAAAAWIESRFRDQMAGQAGNNLVMELTRFLMGGGMATGS